MKRTGFKDFNRKLNPKEEDVVGNLLSSGQFILCGSRRMVKKSGFDGLDWSNVKQSDWDLSFPEFSSTARGCLFASGFELQELSPDHLDLYGDVTFRELWKHPTLRIEAVGRYNSVSVEKFWYRLDSTFYHKHLWKSAPHRDPSLIPEHKQFIRDFINQSIGFLG
jgi:hypothetical protein